MSEGENMVERCARAILAKVPQGYGMTKGEAANYARAVIEALLEPTPGMLAAGVMSARQADQYEMAYKRPSRFASIFPMSFDYTPGRIGRRRHSVRPHPLRELFDLRDKLKPTTN